MRGWSALVVPVALGLWACGGGGAAPDAGAPEAGGEGGSPDAGPPADAARGPSPVAPEIPWLDAGGPPVAAPVLVPCPPGWREVSAPGEPTTCDPYPAGGAASCPPGQVHFPGEPGCVVVGTPCGSDGRAADLPADRPIAYVRAGAEPGGDGTRARPFATLEEAMTRSAAEIVALARGSYAEQIPLGGRTLWGACAAETVLTHPEFSRVAGVVVAGWEPATIRNLRIGPSARIGIMVADGAELELRDVVIEGNESFGVLVIGAGTRLRGSSVVIRDTHAGVDPAAGVALLVRLGASVELERAVLERGVHDVLGVGAGSHATLRDVVLRGAGPAAPSGHVSGLRAEEDSTTELERVLVEGVPGTGVQVAGGALQATDLLVRDTRVADGEHGRGVDLENATATLARVLVERGDTIGIGLLASDATLDDAVVRDIAHRASFGLYGAGVEAADGSRLEGSRWDLRRVAAVGVHAAGGAALVARDLGVADMLAREDGTAGVGVLVQQASDVRVAGLLVERARDSGLVARDTGSRLVLEDFALLDTRGSVAGGGEGGWIFSAAAELRRGLVAGNHTLGLGVVGGGGTVLEDLVIRGTLPSPLDDARGRGLEVGYGASVDGARLLLERNREWSVVVLDGARAQLEDVAVLQTLEAACVDTTCARAAAGIGVSVSRQDGAATATAPPARLGLARFLIDDAALCGMQISAGGELDATSGVVRGAAVGMCVQVDGFDLGRVDDDVHYLDNGVNLQATSYPPPSAVDWDVDS